ncbi:MAG: heme ABC transporter ATP-binding protein [Parahaliea sp.]
MAEQTLLNTSQLCAAPWGKTLLSQITFSLMPGKILAIIGPNGAGKSTLLHCLAGGISPSSGKLQLGTQALANWPRPERARSLALLPQQSTLDFPFAVTEVIQLGRSPHASGAIEDRRIVQQVMAATDTLSLAKRLYTHLSGGERQRVQLARVMAQIWRATDSPLRLLLLDEPTTGLDLEHQQLVADSVRTLATDGVGIILAVHDFNFAARLADEVLVLAAGQQQALGPSREVFNKTLFADIFRVRVHIGSHPDGGQPLVIQS